jgi:hypothetical protein
MNNKVWTSRQLKFGIGSERNDKNECRKASDRSKENKPETNHTLAKESKSTNKSKSHESSDFDERVLQAVKKAIAIRDERLSASPATNG